MLIFFACRDCFHMYWPHYLKPWQCLIWEYKNTHTNGQNSCQFVKKAPFSCLHLNYHWSHAQRLNILCSLAPKKALNAFRLVCYFLWKTRKRSLHCSEIFPVDKQSQYMSWLNRQFIMHIWSLGGEWKRSGISWSPKGLLGNTFYSKLVFFKRLVSPLPCYCCGNSVWVDRQKIET